MIKACFKARHNALSGRGWFSTVVATSKKYQKKRTCFLRRRAPLLLENKTAQANGCHTVCHHQHRACDETICRCVRVALVETGVEAHVVEEEKKKEAASAR